jgi:enamine deaminase RidA (YjgF/YER057c/UK114 family)
MEQQANWSRYGNSLVSCHKFISNSRKHRYPPAVLAGTPPVCSLDRPYFARQVGGHCSAVCLPSSWAAWAGHRLGHANHQGRHTDVANVAATDGVRVHLEWGPVWDLVVVAKRMMAVAGKIGRAAAEAVDTSATAQLVLVVEDIDPAVEPAGIAEVPYTILLQMEESQACRGEEAEVCRQAEPLALVEELLAWRTAALVVPAVGNRVGNRREEASSQPC